MACLEILEGFHRGTQGPLPDEALLGRHRESWLCLPEARVSRQHARILRRETTFVIEDLQSSHGVLVRASGSSRMSPIPSTMAMRFELAPPAWSFVSTHHRPSGSLRIGPLAMAAP